MTDMDREEALITLEQSPPLLPSQRLRSARFLAQNATKADQSRIVRIRRTEYDSWVQKALDQAITRITERKPKVVNTEEEKEVDPFRRQFYEDVFAQATREYSEIFLHELRPLVGFLEVDANGEVNCYKCSNTKKSIARIRSCLDTIEMLRNASQAPVVKGFDLTDLVSQVSEVEARRNLVLSGILPEEENDSRILDNHIRQFIKLTGIEIIFARKEPVLCLGAPKLIKLAVGNALRNAIEAVLDVQDKDYREIVLNWGVTDVDNWVVILDDGGGLPEGSNHLMDPGVSMKAKGESNFGMGLTIAQKALRSINGTIRLASRPTVGTLCEIRWPQKEEMQ